MNSRIDHLKLTIQVADLGHLQGTLDALAGIDMHSEHVDVELVIPPNFPATPVSTADQQALDAVSQQTADLSKQVSGLENQAGSIHP